MPPDCTLGAPEYTLVPPEYTLEAPEYTFLATEYTLLAPEHSVVASEYTSVAPEYMPASASMRTTDIRGHVNTHAANLLPAGLVRDGLARYTRSSSVN